MENLKIFNAKWSSSSAGPSLDHNLRTEIFLAGCKMAAEGNPCPGCFNSELWKTEGFIGASQSPEEAFQHIKKFAPNKYITFVGGEPLDQIEPLAELCQLLKEDGFNIIVITHYLGEYINMLSITEPAYSKLIHNIDAIIDGEYVEDLRIWDEEKAGDGLHDVIGSANQRIWDYHQWRKSGAGDREFNKIEVTEAGTLMGWFMNVTGGFSYVMKDKTEEEIFFENYKEVADYE